MAALGRVEDGRGRIVVVDVGLDVEALGAHVEATASSSCSACSVRAIWNPHALAARLTQRLPPYLAQAIDPVARGLSHQPLAGPIAPLWSALAPALQSHPAAVEAAVDAALHPHDPDAVATFRRQLRRLLDAEPALARALTDMLAPTSPPGARSQTIHGRQVGSPTTFGDHSGITIDDLSSDRDP